MKTIWVPTIAFFLLTVVIFGINHHTLRQLPIDDNWREEHEEIMARLKELSKPINVQAQIDSAWRVYEDSVKCVNERWLQRAND